MRSPKGIVAFCALLLVFSMLLAGCIKSMDVEPAPEESDGDSDGSGQEGDGEKPNQRTPSPTPEPTETEEDEPEEEEEEKDDGPTDPTADLSANRTSGEAPLSVNFTLNGTTDEGLILNWTLDFGDGSEPVSGGSLPANHTHEYDEVGNYTAVLNVTDGLKNATDDIKITVEEEEQDPPEPVDADASIDVVDDPWTLFQDQTTMAPITVTTGGESVIQWNWMGSLDHSVTSDDGEFDSGVLPSGSSFTVTLNEPGIYTYHCTIHEDSGQQGVIVVLDG